MLSIKKYIWFNRQTDTRSYSPQAAVSGGLLMWAQSVCVGISVRAQGLKSFVYKMDEFKACNLDYFPENILIDVLSYLSVRELVRAGR